MESSTTHTHKHTKTIELDHSRSISFIERVQCTCMKGLAFCVWKILLTLSKSTTRAVRRPLGSAKFVFKAKSASRKVPN
jgi:hypothetical protein